MATVDTHATRERRHVADRRATSTSATGSRLTTLDWVAMALVIVGGINWGLIGLFSFDLVAALFGTMSILTRIVYTLVGISAVYTIYTCKKLADEKA